jgi:hypothetical protein
VSIDALALVSTLFSFVNAGLVPISVVTIRTLLRWFAGFAGILRKPLMAACPAFIFGHLNIDDRHVLA